MADEKAQKPAQPQDQPAAQPQPDPPMAFSETVPGGKYLQDGRLVDAWGEPVKGGK